MTSFLIIKINMPSKKSTKPTEPTGRVFLIDSFSHIFRAFFAPMGGRMEPLTNSQGQVTQAVFVFTNMLRKLLADEKPQYIAAVFESEVPTFRHEMSADYKANRAQMPDELESQIPYIKRVCDVYGLPILNVPGFEADDVIGALAVQCAAEGLQAVIVSNDKDMCQLVRDPWIVCMRQNSQNVKRKEPVPPVEWCDEAWVETKFGVPPAQIVDLLGLMGDSVDNIPGAPGIGAKGAVAIVKQFGSIERALEGWEEVKHKTYRESLRDNAQLIMQSKELATIKTDVNINLDLDKLRHHPPDRAAAYTLFRELEFQSLTREFADAASSVEGAGAQARNYRFIRKPAELEGLLRKLYDTDHWSFSLSDSTPAGAGQQASTREQAPPSGIAISTAPNVASFIDLQNFEGGAEAALPPLRDVLSNGLLQKSVHDLKRTVALLAPLDIELEGVSDDTLLAAYLLDPIRSRYDLGDLAREALGIDGWTERLDDTWTDEQWRAAETADFTAQVSDVLHGRILEQGLEPIYNEIELPLAPLLYRMERAGLRVDTAVLGELSAVFGAELAKLTEQIHKLAGREFKISSPKQVGEIFEELNISSGRKTSTGQVSTSRAVLEELAQKYELPRLIIEYRELDKLKATYTDSLPHQIGPDGRIHSQLNQTVTATGRLSSSEPNLQNIPIRTELGRRIRRAFVPEKGHRFVAADYSQLELRLLAHITRDEKMLAAFQNDEDIHAQTARLVFGAKTPEELKDKRRFAKIVNFAIAYAVEPFGLSQRVGISRKEARQVIDDFYKTYTGVRRFMDEVPEKARETGNVRSIYGRIRPIPTINDRNGQIRARAEREAINMPIQGCLPYETKVLTSEGYQPIGELYRSGSLGLRVWTGTRFANFEVLNRGLCELAELHLSNGQVLRCDTRHEVLVLTDEGYVWKRYPDLEAGDRVCLSLPQEIEFGSVGGLKGVPQTNAGNVLPFAIGEFGTEFFYWLGYYVGDGWITHKPQEHRWSLAYSLGMAKAERRGEIVARAEECNAYFGSLGLRTNFRWQSRQKGELTIYSKGLVEFLSRIGVNTHAKAATKRVPDFVFRSPLSARKAFLRGVLDADGYHGSDGATNPSIHLCQRDLLDDLRLLFRTVGVEGKLRGPYTYREHVSYRLDLAGGMLGRAVRFSNCRSVRMPGMRALGFIVEAFLQEVSPAQLGRHSHRVLYSRLKHGGAVSIYTLAEMVRASGKTLSIPLYAWSRIRGKRALGIVEETYTLAVDDPQHRFDSEGVISKNTASDIVKIAMLKVEEALRREGLRAQMVMQVHDELLVESPKDEAERVAELLRREMMSAVELDVPLEVEVGIGDNWMEVK
ncbi:MAG TPA: DNA polymerase I [Pyrinomonadaceae bacterium]|nr:DNA polymerase I [Pyrinomonadaceae bacterium]